MTPYQRGNRDGLLSFAATCEARANDENDQGDHLAKHRTMGERLSVNRYYAAAAWMDAARLARVAAEALPEDPEAPPPSEWEQEQEALRLSRQPAATIAMKSPHGQVLPGS